MSIPTPSQFLNSLLVVNPERTVVRHKLNSERAYLVSPDSDVDVVATRLKSKMGLISLAIFALSFMAYVLVSNHLFGGTLNYKKSPETMIYAPALICSLIVTYVSVRYANIMYRDRVALSVPVDLANDIDEDDIPLLFLAAENGELDSALASLRRSLSETGD